MNRPLRALLILVLAAALAGCGFKLRGPQTFPFQTIAVPGVTPLRVEIKRAIETHSNASVVQGVKEAEAVLEITREAQEKVILSLTTQGRVREYQLRYLVSYRVARNAGGVYVPPTTILLTRDITFNDQILAKETEEQQLYAEMRSDFVQQLMRRMAAAKPILPDEY